MLVEGAGEHGGRGAALADDGKAVELHEELVHEHAVLRVHLAVAVAELADVQAEALEHGVDIVDEGGEDAGEEKRSVRPEADDMGPVQVGEVRHEGRIVLHERKIRFGELHAENVLMHAGKARQERLHVLPHGRLPVVRSARGKEPVVLETLVKILERPVEHHHGEAGQVLVLVHGVVERGQKLSRLNQGIGRVVRVGLGQAHTDMHGVKEAQHVGQGAQAGAEGGCVFVLPGRLPAGKYILPFDHRCFPGEKFPMPGVTVPIVWYWCKS